jgi:predicted XRE-type DNA-binding protein
MKKMSDTATAHVSSGNVLDDLGLDQITTALIKAKTDIWFEIRDHFDREGLSQRELCELLNEHQPAVSELINGRLKRMSVDRLLKYAALLGMEFDVVKRAQ